MSQKQFSRFQPWEVVLPNHIEMFGTEILDAGKRAAWCRAFFYAGTTLRLWNEAPELKAALLSACALKDVTRLVLICKYGEESELVPALQSLLPSDCEMEVREIGRQAMDVFSNLTSSSDNQLQWDFDYFDTLADGSVDRVILFGAVSHIRSLESCANNICRVLRDGGRVIIADTPWGGKDLAAAANMDAHLEGFLARILSGMGIEIEDLPDTGVESLKSAFEPLLNWSRVFSWRGLFLFYGQNGANENRLSLGPLPATDAVDKFIALKQTQSPWDLISEVEKYVLGPDVINPAVQRNWGRAVFFSGNLDWMYTRAGNMLHIMYQNLKAKKGDKVLVIGEKLEVLGFLPELRKLVGETGEIASFDMVGASHKAYKQQWKMGPDQFVEEKHRWDYPFADTYPDNYFDMVWLPQGVHHARSWEEIAPRLLRVLKTGRQVMMIENRTCPPAFFKAIEINGFLRCIAEKVYWGMDTTFEEMPDYTTLDLESAFGNSLTDIFSLEWKGWLLFWGYKK
ncbi:methyltransferase domain-containing protein [Chloroflexota bacterium]